MTLNAISGIGMLAVGTLGFPYIGALQAGKQISAVEQDKQIAAELPGLLEDGKLTVLEERRIYEIIRYYAIDDARLNRLIAELPEAQRTMVAEQIATVRARSNKGALANMAIFPAIMLVGYLILIVYFVSRGGYKAQILVGHAAEDRKYTGGVEGPVEA